MVEEKSALFKSKAAIPANLPPDVAAMQAYQPRYNLSYQHEDLNVS